MRVLRHAYVQEGEPRPTDSDGETLLPGEFVHVSSRQDGTGLDIWWWEWQDDEEEPDATS